MILSGVKNISWARTPGFTERDLLLGCKPLGEYDAAGAWSHPVDDGNSGEFTDVTEVRNGVEVHISTLTFKINPNVYPFLANLPMACEPQCWRFSEKDGNTYFIGSGERPYPSITINSENVRGSNVKTRTATITWTSLIGPMIRRKSRP